MGVAEIADLNCNAHKHAHINIVSTYVPIIWWCCYLHYTIICTYIHTHIYMCVHVRSAVLDLNHVHVHVWLCSLWAFPPSSYKYNSLVDTQYTHTSCVYIHLHRHCIKVLYTYLYNTLLYYYTVTLLNVRVNKSSRLRYLTHSRCRQDFNATFRSPRPSSTLTLIQWTLSYIITEENRNSFLWGTQDILDKHAAIVS